MEPPELTPIAGFYARAKSGKIDLMWSHVPDAVSYNIYRSETSGGPYEPIAEGHVTDYCAFADFGLTNGVTYYYVVSWLDANGNESPPSDEVSATPTARTRR